MFPKLPFLLLSLYFSAGKSQVQQRKPFVEEIFFNKEKTFPDKISDAALSLIKDAVIYDGSYFVIDYPNGDVPKGKGVCTDVVIRTFRKLGIDLQKELHEDISANWEAYPHLWNRNTPDKNIDHRRVPNLMAYFKRKEKELTITNNVKDYVPGDIVAWRLSNGLTHIGIVVNVPGENNKYQIVHNIGRGQEISDCLFDFTIIGHYRMIRK